MTLRMAFAAEWIAKDSEANIDVHQFGNVIGISTAHYTDRECTSDSNLI